MSHFFFPYCSAVFSSFFPYIRHSNKIKIQFLVMIHKTGNMGTAMAVRKTNHSNSYTIVGAKDIAVAFGSKSI